MNVAILLYPRHTALDWVGPHEVLNSVPGVECFTVAKEAGPVENESHNLELVASRSLAEVDSADILVIPGGYGNRVLVEDTELARWVRAIHETTTYTTSVCTGALLLAAAGLLDGAPATTHWLARDGLQALGATPVPDRIVEHGKIITAAGVSAGIDMAFRLVQKIYGDEVAQAVQLGIEYDPQPLFDSGSPEKANPQIVELVRQANDAAEQASAGAA